MAYDSMQKDFDPAKTSANTRGIVFHAGSRRRFIPYAWLLFAEMNAEATELQFHYTYCTVVVIGRSLQSLLNWAADFSLAIVRESPVSAFSGRGPIVQRIEVTETSTP